MYLTSKGPGLVGPLNRPICDECDNTCGWVCGGGCGSACAYESYFN